MLRQLYEAQLEASPDDEYLRAHADPRFMRGNVLVFQFYRQYLPAQGRILDWGCRHAPDACMIRSELGDGVQLDGCDTVEPDLYPSFWNYARLNYARLDHPVCLPYADGSFDAVVASGTLEHTAMDYESLKELHRVIRLGAHLVITYLPNRWSIAEWYLRRRHPGSAHVRVYRREQIRRLLLHAGFRPTVLGHQTRLDLLPSRARIVRPLARSVLLHRLTSCLCVVAEKVGAF